MTNDKPKSWRDVLPIHPDADEFDLLPPDELKAIGEDIKKRGLQSPVSVWAAGDSEGSRMGSDPPGAKYELLDGRNRLDAAEAVGLIVVVDSRGFVSIKGMDVDQRGSQSQRLYEFKVSWDAFTHKRVREKWIDPYEFVIAANIHRRHLTTAKRIELVEKLLKRNPRMSARRASKLAGVSPTTGTKARDRLEQRGDVSTVDTSIDTKGRKQPAKKKRRTADDFVAEKKAREKAHAKAVADRAEERSRQTHAEQTQKAAQASVAVPKQYDDAKAVAVPEAAKPANAKAAAPAKSLIGWRSKLTAALVESFNDLSEADRKTLFDDLRALMAWMEQPGGGCCGAGAPVAIGETVGALDLRETMRPGLPNFSVRERAGRPA